MNKISTLTRNIYVTQIMMSLASVLLVVPLYSLAQERPLVYSLITSFFYLASVYTCIWRAGARDSRKIPGYYPNKKLPIKLSVYTAIVPVILLAVRLIAPDILSADLPFLNGSYDFLLSGCRVYGTPDFIYRLWYFPFAAFIPSGNIAAYIIELLILPATIFAAYYIGLTRFSLIEFVWQKLIYSNKRNTNKKGK